MTLNRIYRLNSTPKGTPKAYIYYHGNNRRIIETPIFTKLIRATLDESASKKPRSSSAGLLKASSNITENISLTVTVISKLRLGPDFAKKLRQGTQASPAYAKATEGRLRRTPKSCGALPPNLKEIQKGDRQNERYFFRPRNVSGKFRWRKKTQA